MSCIKSCEKCGGGYTSCSRHCGKCGHLVNKSVPESKNCAFLHLGYLTVGNHSHCPRCGKNIKNFTVAIPRFKKLFELRILQ